MTAQLGQEQVVELIDLSSHGVCVQTARRIVPGATVDLKLEHHGESFSLRARVVRCTVAAVTRERVTYRAGMQFAASVAQWLNGVAVADARIA